MNYGLKICLRNAESLLEGVHVVQLFPGESFNDFLFRLSVKANRDSLLSWYTAHVAISCGFGKDRIF